MVSIKDVAERAGVSVATVSRVLANKPHVRREVREHVLRIVEELGYRPNRTASSLRKQTSQVIGLLVSDIRNPFFTDIARAIEDIAIANQRSVFFCNTDEDPEKEQLYLNNLMDENVAGIIFSPALETPGSYELLLNSNIPVVTIDRRIEGAGIDAVLGNNIETACTITDHLIEHGFRRIGAVIGLSTITTGRERMFGYHQSMNRHGLEPLGEFITPKEEFAEVVVSRWLSSKNPPDAIFAGNSRMVAGTLNAIKNAGLTIPDDVAVAGFDETVWMHHVGPGITTIAQPTYEMGRTAAELLLQRIEEPKRSAREVILHGYLIERGSTQAR